MNKMDFPSWNLYSNKTVIITNIYKCEACCYKGEVEGAIQSTAVGKRLRSTTLVVNLGDNHFELQ